MGTVKLDARGLRRLIESEVRSLGRRRRLREGATSKIDWSDRDATEAISDAIEELASAIIDYFVDDDPEKHDMFHVDVHNDILEFVNKTAREFDWNGDYDDTGELKGGSGGGGGGDDDEYDVSHSGPQGSFTTYKRKDRPPYSDDT